MLYYVAETKQGLQINEYLGEENLLKLERKEDGFKVLEFIYSLVPPESYTLGQGGDVINQILYILSGLTNRPIRDELRPRMSQSRHIGEVYAILRESEGSLIVDRIVRRIDILIKNRKQ